MDIGQVLSRAWKIIWRHKVLWLFGILASCGSAGGNAGGVQSSFSDGGAGPEYYFNQIPQEQVILLACVIFIVVLILVVLAIFLSTIGRIGVIRGTLQAENQGEEARLQFGELFSGSMPYFWRVFGMNLLVGLGLALAITIIIVPLAIVLALSVVGLICLIPLIILLIPLAWLVGVWLEQASVAIVVNDLGIGDALRQGWEVIRANLGTMIVMALILYLGVGLVGGLIIGLPLAIIVFPAMASIASGADQALRGGLLVAALCFVAWLPFAIVLNGILQTYIKSAWTLTYLRLTRPRTTGEVPAAL